MIVQLTTLLAIAFLLNSALRPPVTQNANAAGKQLYEKHCLACHQADGSGVQDMFPPLAGNPRLSASPGELAGIIINGMKGPVKVKETTYDQEMPPMQYLKDNEIALILTYVRTSWGNKSPAVTAADVAKARKQPVK